MIQDIYLKPESVKLWVTLVEGGINDKGYQRGMNTAHAWDFLKYGQIFKKNYQSYQNSVKVYLAGNIAHQLSKSHGYKIKGSLECTRTLISSRLMIMLID